MTTISLGHSATSRIKHSLHFYSQYYSDNRFNHPIRSSLQLPISYNTCKLYLQLPYRFILTMPACVIMLLTFLFELTSESHDMRSIIYKTELTKVFFSVLHFYLLSMIFANWIKTLRKFIVGVFRSQEKLKSNAPANIAGAGKIALPRQKKDQIQRFTLTRFTLSDAFDLFTNQFDQYVLEECQHFLRDDAFLDVMR